MIQGLRLRPSTAEDTGLILDWGTGIPQAVWCGKKKIDRNYWFQQVRRAGQRAEKRLES